MKLISNLIICLVVLLTFGIGHLVVAQTPTPTPTEEELKLQAEKRLLELQRDIELAKKAIRDAQPAEPTPPEPKATPLEGNTTLTDVRIETSMVTYNAMSDVANIIAEEISSRASSARNLLIYDAQTIRDWRFHQALFPAFKGQTTDIKNRYFELVCRHPQASQEFQRVYCTDRDAQPFTTPAEATRERMNIAGVASAIGAGETLIRSFIDLAALFRTETKIEGVAVTAEEGAFVAELARALRNQYCRPPGQCFPITVYYPAAFPPRVKESDTIFRVGILFVFKTEADRLIKLMSVRKPALVTQLNALAAKKAEAEEALARIKALEKIIDNLNGALNRETVPYFRNKLWEEKTKADVALAALGPAAVQQQVISQADSGIAALKLEIKTIDDSVKALTELNDRFQAFVDQFIKLDEKGSNALALFIKSEDIDAIINNPDGRESYWLEVKSVIAGGNNRTRKNLIWFFAGARVDHSGGLVAQYTLYDQTGAIVASDKIAYYRGYLEPRKIQNGKLVDAVR